MSFSRICFVIAAVLFALAYFGAPVSKAEVAGLFFVAIGLAA